MNELLSLSHTKKDPVSRTRLRRNRCLCRGGGGGGDLEEAGNGLSNIFCD